MSRRPKSSGSDDADAESVALRKQAREGAGDAMAKLLELSLEANSEAVKLGAIKELFDRGFGRVGQGERAGAVVAHLLIDDGYES